MSFFLVVPKFFYGIFISSFGTSFIDGEGGNFAHKQTFNYIFHFFPLVLNGSLFNPLSSHPSLNRKKVTRRETFFFECCKTKTNFINYKIKIKRFPLFIFFLLRARVSFSPPPKIIRNRINFSLFFRRCLINLSDP